ncbi:MAG: hypothetical protein ABI301_07200 [Jatrophihabitantaceae bacterium]
MTEQFDGDDPGPRGDDLGDAMRMVSAVQDWASRTFPASPDGHTGSDCQWCPICQFMGVLRGERPEVTERVAEAGTALASAFRAFVDAATPRSDDGGAHGHHGEAPRPRVQRIDLGADPAAETE